ncbi:hypothetical protein [Sinomicrobium sp. M5D2P17]
MQTKQNEFEGIRIKVSTINKGNDCYAKRERQLNANNNGEWIQK